MPRGRKKETTVKRDRVFAYNEDYKAMYEAKCAELEKVKDSFKSKAEYELGDLQEKHDKLLASLEGGGRPTIKGFKEKFKEVVDYGDQILQTDSSYSAKIVNRLCRTKLTAIWHSVKNL